MEDIYIFLGSSFDLLEDSLVRGPSCERTTASQMPSTSKRKLDDAEFVGLTFVKSFGSVNYVGTVTACGIGPDGIRQVCKVVYDDGDDEVITSSEVLNWRRKGLESTTIGNSSKRPKSATQLSPQEGADTTTAVPKSSAKKASRNASSSRGVPLEATSTTRGAQKAKKFNQQSSVVLKSLPSSTLGAGKHPATAEATAASFAAVDASLRLTVISAAAGEAVANVALPLLADASGLTSDVVGGFGACWWAGLALNVTGSALSGVASVVEQEGASKEINRPRAAAAAASLRGGFLGAYTSFAGMALQAGEFTSSSSGGGDGMAVGGASVAIVAGSLGLGAMAFAVGRFAAYLCLPWFLSSASAGKLKSGNITATESIDNAEAAAPPVALELACLVIMWLCLLVANDDAPDLAMGMLCASLAALVGTATNASNSTANAWATLMALVARAIPLLGPKTSLPWLSGHTLLLVKFEGSFCGALSTFCGAAEDLTATATSIYARLVGGSRDTFLVNDPALRSFAASASIATIGAFCSAYLASLGAGSGPSADSNSFIQFDLFPFVSASTAVVAMLVASAFLLRQIKE